MTEYIMIVKDLGFPIAIALILLYFIISKGSNKLEEIKQLLTIIALNVGKTLLTSEQTILVFNWCLNEHFTKKIRYAKDILKENDIYKREAQIKKNLVVEFKRISEEEAMKLSQFNTPAGDLGKILLGVNFKKFIEEFYLIFFSNDDMNKKCEDMYSLMSGYANDLMIEIKDKIKYNTI